MKEQEYIKSKALGTITAATRVLNDIVTENLGGDITQRDLATVLNLMDKWKERLRAGTKIENENEKNDK
ncbi:hypothetical protein [Cyclobacterium marinum]|uniref:Uncharacterized protein n=1 Tax=Cyclobacterium marinum (strain ATCC 25205 / DSM 745 / LMG 13164 / NCIMB 1802) TaxID=880070 RepID=G0IY03_CYCMS|nr:hypothetical protein [Cyclobacterium marinum]AEL24336.1 hypothetical protein Cycma_0561 [Cyclobacterium marinum DSM 745]